MCIITSSRLFTSQKIVIESSLPVAVGLIPLTPAGLRSNRSHRWTSTGSSPLFCRTLLPDVSPILIEIPQDTARAVTNLLFTGTFAKFKDIRFIFAHAGGNVPMLLGRMHQYGPKNIAEKAPNGIEYELKRHYYDIAGTAYRPAIAALKSLVPTTQILFGSDN